MTSAEFGHEVLLAWSVDGTCHVYDYGAKSDVCNSKEFFGCGPVVWVCRVAVTIPATEYNIPVILVVGWMALVLSERGIKSRRIVWQ